MILETSFRSFILNKQIWRQLQLVRIKNEENLTIEIENKSQIIDFKIIETIENMFIERDKFIMIDPILFQI